MSTAELITHNDTLVLAPSTRAFEVLDKIQAIRNNVEDCFLDLCYLLDEALENEYHLTYGYSNFADWVEEGSGLDMSARQARYLINIARKSRELGVDREQMKRIGVSKLKEIFTLNPSDDGETIRGLLAAAEEDSVDTVRTKARKARTGDTTTAAYITLKLEEGVKDVFDEAVELARKNYGSTVNDHDEIVDISVSRAVELICASYLADVNNKVNHD